MKSDYMFINGRKVRVELNWSTIAAFCAQKGTSTIEFLSAASKLPPADMALLLVCAVKEGERLDGNDCDITVDDVNALPLREINRFLDIYVRQASPDIPDEQEKKE